MKEYLLPVKVVATSGIVENPEGLFVDKGKYAVILKDEAIRNTYTILRNKGASITLDFGQEMHGGIRVITEWVGKSSCKCRVRYGESIGEVNSDIGYKNATNHHSPRDFETSIVAYSDLVLGQSGFRYARIDVLEDNPCVIFKNIYVENNILDLPTIYEYQGRDERIKEIFKVAKRTVDLCSGAGVVWDGIKRDRMLWIGDLFPEVMALSTLYGRTKLVESTIDTTIEMTPLPNAFNGILTYSMYWIYMMADYLKELNARDYIEKHLDYIVNLVKCLDSNIDEEGNVTKDIRCLVDWPTVGTEDEEVGTRIVLLMSMNSAEYIYEQFSLDKTIINNIKRKAMIKSLEVKKMKQVIALKYFALGDISDEEYERLIQGRSKGFSTFMSYFLLKAVASKDEKLAIELMKEFYGGMLDRGATTFWEDFNIEWLEGSGRIDEFTSDGLKDLHGDYGAHCYVGYRHSLCHGWSAGVIKFIKEHC